MIVPWGGRSLQRRLLISMATGFVLLLLLLSILLWTYARSAANRTQDLLLAGAALAILERTSIGPDGPTVDLPSSAMEILSLNPVDRAHYRVFVPGRGEITGTHDLPVAPRNDPSAVPAFYDAVYRGATFRFVQQARRLNAPESREWIAVQVGQTVEARSGQQRLFFLTGLAGIGAVSLIGLGFVWLAIRTSLAPLRQIEADLTQRAPNDLAEVAGEPPREIRGLFDAINGFITRLGQSRTLTETFIADVAHQTRTSLAALQGQLALAADAGTFQGMRDRVAKAEAQSERTVRLTNQLLANAMVIHRSDHANLRPVKLKPLVRDTLAEILRDSRLRLVSLSLDSDGLASGHDLISGDALSIREALRNLIENAVRHGPPDSTIVISLREAQSRVMLSVDDSGPGIPQADLSRAVERFTSIASKTKGSGLGLSIVKAVADGHGAEFALGRSDLGGLRATILFPRLGVLLAALCVAVFTGGAEAQTLRIFSASDTRAMQPLVDAFEARQPGVTVDYTEFQTLDLYNEIRDGRSLLQPDVVISSAMDLQVALVNRGMAQRIYPSPETPPPPWATWRSELFGFTFEPAVLIYDRRTISKDDLPRYHRDLATFVRENEARLRGRIGTYDIRSSGIGYLYATQDSLQGPQAQRLIEVLGRAGVQTFCCTSEMFDATARGDLTLAINTIGSYAAAVAENVPHVGLHFFDDYNLVMTRTAFVAKDAENPELAARFIEFLLSEAGQSIMAESSLLIPLVSEPDPRRPILGQIDRRRGTFLPIRLNLGLMTFLDQLKQRDFLDAWDISLGYRP